MKYNLTSRRFYTGRVGNFSCKEGWKWLLNREIKNLVFWYAGLRCPKVNTQLSRYSIIALSTIMCNKHSNIVYNWYCIPDILFTCTRCDNSCIYSDPRSVEMRADAGHWGRRQKWSHPKWTKKNVTKSGIWRDWRQVSWKKQSSQVIWCDLKEVRGKFSWILFSSEPDRWLSFMLDAVDNGIYNQSFATKQSHQTPNCSLNWLLSDSQPKQLPFLTNLCADFSKSWKSKSSFLPPGHNHQMIGCEVLEVCYKISIPIEP